MKICGVNNGIHYINHDRYRFNTVCAASKKTAFCSSFKEGVCIKNIGKIIKEVPIYNDIKGNSDSGYLIYKKNKKGGVVKLFVKNDEKIRELSEKISNDPKALEFLDKFNHYTMGVILDKLQMINPKVSKLYDDLRISECGFILIDDLKDKDALMSKGYKPIDLEKDFVFIEDFYVDKKKGYGTASKSTAICLFEILNDEKNNNILAIAQAIGKDSKSPVNLYLRAGFKPLRMTIEEIEQHTIDTPKGKRLDPKLAVSMYLPKDAYIYQIIRRNNLGIA